MAIVGNSRLMEVDLREHKVASKDQSLSSVETALCQSDPWTRLLANFRKHQAANQATPIKSPVIDPSVIGIAKQVVNSIGIELTSDQVPPNQRATDASRTSIRSRRKASSVKFMSLRRNSFEFSVSASNILVAT